MSDIGFTNQTAFGIHEKYGDIDEMGNIATDQFLKACTDMTTIVERLGTGFIPPKKDMQGNIKKLDEKYKSDPSKYDSLQTIIEDGAEVKEKTGKTTDAVVSLLWLKRTLEFIGCFIESLSKDFKSCVEEQNLRETILKAYDETLKPFHGRMTQFVFSNVARFAPSRKDFLTGLITSNDGTLEMAVSDIDLFLPNMKANISKLNEQLAKYNLDSKDKTF